LNHTLAPSLVSKIDAAYLLWFEHSNQYLVLPESIKALVEVFLEAPNETAFIVKMQYHNNSSPTIAATYYAEIKALLATAHIPKAAQAKVVNPPPLPTPREKVYYAFGNTSIAVHYGSLHLKNLLHPQRRHAVALENKTPDAVFDVFENEGHFYLFKDHNYQGHYTPSELHLLQGQFSLQLINTLYKKEEADWIATFHASTVCNTKEAIMIIGASGNGKSTLSAILMAHGYDLLADDFTPLAAHNKALYRVPSGISIKETAFNSLKPLFSDFEHYPHSQSTSKSVQIKYIPPAQSFEKAISHLPCTKIVYVSYNPDAAQELKTVPIQKILETLIPESWLSPLASNSQLFLEWLKEVHCFELTYADNNFAISQFETLFKP
jgi:hypothetical protein